MDVKEMTGLSWLNVRPDKGSFEDGIEYSFS
jgi:hypothetical protein